MENLAVKFYLLQQWDKYLLINILIAGFDFWKQERVWVESPYII